MSIKRITQSFATAVVVVTAFAALAGPAAAYTVQSNGYPGGVGVPRVYGAQIVDLSSMNAATGDIFNLQKYAAVTHESLFLYSPQRWISRSPATSGAQIATVSYRVWLRQYCGDIAAANGYCKPNSWQYDPSASTSARVVIPAGRSSLTLTAWKTALNANWPDGANVGFDVVVVWRDAYGRYLGRKIVDYASAGDFGCLIGGCSVKQPPGFSASVMVGDNA